MGLVSASLSEQVGSSHPPHIIGREAGGRAGHGECWLAAIEPQAQASVVAGLNGVDRPVDQVKQCDRRPLRVPVSKPGAAGLQPELGVDEETHLSAGLRVAEREVWPDLPETDLDDEPAGQRFWIDPHRTSSTERPGVRSSPTGNPTRPARPHRKRSIGGVGEA